MKVVHRLLLCSALGALLPSAMAQSCPNLVVYYGNGVGFGNDNVRSAASDARNLLRSEVIAKLTSKQSFATQFKRAFNPSEGILLDSLEAARQQLGIEYPALATALILRIANLTPVLLALQATLSPEQIKAFNDFFQNRTVQELVQGTSSTTTVDVHYNHYNLDIPGKRVILVAHSQGNIFANLAYQRLNNFQRLYFADVSVASPESVEPASRVGHTRFLDDLVIAAVETARVKAGLPPPLGFTDFATHGAETGFHGFLEAYMAEVQSNAFIISGVVNTLGLLPPASDTCSATPTGAITYLPKQFAGLALVNPKCSVIGTIPSVVRFASDGSISGTQCYASLNAPADSPYYYAQHDGVFENTLVVDRPNLSTLLSLTTQPDGSATVGVRDVSGATFATQGVSLHTDLNGRVASALKLISGRRCQANIRGENINGDSYVDYDSSLVQIKQGLQS